jgi:hypothetical protein
MTDSCNRPPPWQRAVGPIEHYATRILATSNAIRKVTRRSLALAIVTRCSAVER